MKMVDTDYMPAYYLRIAESFELNKIELLSDLLQHADNMWLEQGLHLFPTTASVE